MIFLEILKDMEKILSTNKHFLLGVWLKDAKNAASNPRVSITQIMMLKWKK